MKNPNSATERDHQAEIEEQKRQETQRNRDFLAAQAAANRQHDINMMYLNSNIGNNRNPVSVATQNTQNILYNKYFSAKKFHQ